MSESDQKIFDMFGSDWLDERVGSKENQIHKRAQSQCLATDDDLETYLDDPYQIEESTINDSCRHQNSQDTRQSSQDLSSRGFSLNGSISSNGYSAMRVSSSCINILRILSNFVGFR